MDLLCRTPPVSVPVNALCSVVGHEAIGYMLRLDCSRHMQLDPEITLILCIE